MIALIKHVKDLSAEFQSHNNTKNIPMCDYSALHYTYKLLEGEPENPKGRKKSKKPKKYEWTIDMNQDGVPPRLAEAFKPHRVPSLSQYLDGLAEHLENDVLSLLDEYYKESLLDGYKEKMSHSKKTYCIREVDTLLKQILEQWPHIKRLPYRSGEIRARNLETAAIVNKLLHLDGDDVVTANNVSQALKDRRRKYNEEPSC